MIIADLHLSGLQPVGRAELSWTTYQHEVLHELHSLWDQLSSKRSRPIPMICAGDVFDKAAPDLLTINMLRNWIRENQIDFWAIPGQHDLMNHSVTHLNKTGYGTCTEILDLCGFNTYLSGYDRRVAYPTEPRKQPPLMVNASGSDYYVRIYGYGWEQGPSVDNEVLEQSGGPVNVYRVAITHEYVYGDKGTSHPGAGGSYHASHLVEEYKNFDMVISGDNHTPFEYRKNKKTPLLINCGSVMRRSIKQRNHKPTVVVLSLQDEKLIACRITLPLDSDRWADDNILLALEAMSANVSLADFQEQTESIANGISQSTMRMYLRAFLGSYGKPELEHHLLRLLSDAKVELDAGERGF